LAELEFVNYGELRRVKKLFEVWSWALYGSGDWPALFQTENVMRKFRFVVALGVWPGCVLLLSATGILLSPLPTTAALAGDLAMVALLKYRGERMRADRTAQALLSARERTQEVIERDQSRYRRLVENINDAIIMDDIEGNIRKLRAVRDLGIGIAIEP